MFGSQTKDAEAIEEREYIRRDDLVDEHSGECNPEESNSFVVRSGVKVQPWCSHVNPFHMMCRLICYTLKNGNHRQILKVIEFDAVGV
jgi:hypothetical protein